MKKRSSQTVAMIKHCKNKKIKDKRLRRENEKEKEELNEFEDDSEET